MAEAVLSVDAEVAFKMHMDLGEGPLWDASVQALYWTDLVNRKLYKGDPISGRSVERDLPYRASRVTPCRNGQMLFSFTRGPAIGSYDGDVFAPLATDFEIPKEVRVNDGACDASGRFWTATYDPTLSAAIGCIYCVENGRVSTKATDITLANGIRFSPDNKTMYFVESLPGRLWAYEFDLAEARLGGRTLLVDYEGTGVKPDGCTIDTDGCVWVAEVNRSRIARYTPAGKLDQAVRVPALKPTSVCFGGVANDVLFITTRCTGDEDNPLAGSVFAARVPATGLTEHPYGNA